MKKFSLNLKIAATMVACIAATSLLWNCSSEDDDEPTNAVRLVKSIVLYGDDGYESRNTYEYDAQNRLTTEYEVRIYGNEYDNHSSTTTITYSDDRIFISRTENNDYGSTYSSTYTATLNSSGYIVELDYRRYVFTYDDKGYLRTHNYGYSHEYTSTWFWDKGNVTIFSQSESEDGPEREYDRRTYTYEDKIPNKPTSIDLGYVFGIIGDMVQCHGWFGKSPVNLPSKVTDSGHVGLDVELVERHEAKLRYVMDNKGYVKEVYLTERRYNEMEDVWGDWEEERLLITITYY